MTKSKMRIYKGRGYSDHAVNMYMEDETEEFASLLIETRHEYIRLPADDVIVALWPRVVGLIEAELEDED